MTTKSVANQNRTQKRALNASRSVGEREFRGRPQQRGTDQKLALAARLGGVCMVWHGPQEGNVGVGAEAEGDAQFTYFQRRKLPPEDSALLAASIQVPATSLLPSGPHQRHLPKQPRAIPVTENVVRGAAVRILVLTRAGRLVPVGMPPPERNLQRRAIQEALPEGIRIRLTSIPPSNLEVLLRSSQPSKPPQPGHAREESTKKL